MYFFWSIVGVNQDNCTHLRRYFEKNIMRNYSIMLFAEILVDLKML